MPTKKKWHNWNNILNHDSSLNRGHTAPSMILRAANNHAPDETPHGGHTRGHQNEHTKKRAHLGDLQDGHHRKHFHKGYRVEPLMGDHPTHSLRGIY
jgi:hypothetical protein